MYSGVQLSYEASIRNMISWVQCIAAAVQKPHKTFVLWATDSDPVAGAEMLATKVQVTTKILPF